VSLCKIIPSEFLVTFDSVWCNSLAVTFDFETSVSNTEFLVTFDLSIKKPCSKLWLNKLLVTLELSNFTVTFAFNSGF